MKRMLSLFLAVSMLLALLPVGVSAVEGEEFTIDYRTYKPETAHADGEGRYYLTSNTVGENWSFDPANTTSSLYYDRGTSGCRLQSQITVSREWQDNTNNVYASIAFKFKAPASGTYNVTTDVFARTICGYVDVHIIDGENKIYIGRMDNYNSSNKDMTKNLLSVTLEGGKEYSIAYTPSENSSGSAGSLYVYRTKFTPTDSPVALGIKASAKATELTKGESTTISVTSNISNGTLYSFKTAGAVLSYKSSNTDVATVADDGTVTAVGAGKTTITATATVGGKDYTDTIDLNVSEIAGEEFELNLNVNNSTVKNSAYTADNSSWYLLSTTHGDN